MSGDGYPMLRAIILSLLILTGAVGTAVAVPPGEAVTAAPVQVHASPDASAPVLTSLEAGRTVTVLGQPKGSAMAWIARGGKPLGYVAADRLLPPDRPRPVLYTAATVSAALAQGGVLPGDQLPARAKAPLLVDLRGIADGRATVQGRRAETVAPADLMPVMGVHGTDPDPGPRFAARLGGYATPAEAGSAWAVIAEDLPELASAGPFIYRRATADGIRFELAAAPFDRAQVDHACRQLTRRERDCWVVEIVRR